MNPVQELHNFLKKVIIEAIETCRGQGLLSYNQLPDFVIEVPREKGHGDFACNIAMLLAREARMAPRKIAEAIVANINTESHERIEKIEVAGPGFINIFLNHSWLYDIPLIVAKMGNRYGYNPRLGQRVQVEFVSANPTGNLHMGNARGGAIGDTLANILDRAGYDVQREFYINDAGNQIEIFTDSLETRYLQLNGYDLPFPENGYAGQDVVDTVKRIISRYGKQLLDMPPEQRRNTLLEYALEEKVNYIRKTLENFGIYYDVWFSEKTLHESGRIDQIVNYLQEKGYVYKEEDALWFKSTLFGDEKDEVIMRANGLPTYFAADIAYHKDKFERGFDWVINVWGADHHGHVARMKGAIEALGYNPDKLDILLMQLVRLYRGGNIVRMSKRTGTTVSLDELIEEVGSDGDHDVDGAGFDELATDLLLGVAGVASGVGHDEPGPAAVGEGSVELLDPEVVAVVGAGHAEGEAGLAGEFVLFDAVDIEGRVGHDEIELADRFVNVVVVGVAFPDIAGEPVDGEVHGGEADGFCGFLLPTRQHPEQESVQPGVDQVLLFLFCFPLFLLE